MCCQTFGAREYCAFILIYLTLVTAVGAVCYAPSPSFPSLVLERDDVATQELGKILDAALYGISNGEVLERWNTSTSSFAIQLTSASQTLWSSYHTATTLGGPTHGTAIVTGDAAFRIASISKTLTVYALLLQPNVSLDDPITKWLPELLENKNDDDGRIEWDQITLRSLASHLGGIHRDSGGPCFLWREVLSKPIDLDDPTAHGFPLVEEQHADTICSLDDTIDACRQASQVFPANYMPSYSNVGFSLLGAVLERATGKSYTEVIESRILKPLGMDHTTSIKPADSDGIIPTGFNDWYKVFGADIATAGFYSTPNDLSSYMRSILTAELLPKSTISAWLKPHSWANSGTTTAYGIPWEIVRTTSLTPDGRPIDLVTKGGALNGYFSTLMLVPEFGLGVSILVAGPTEAMEDLRERITSALVPAADRIVRRHAKSRYSGIYKLHKEANNQLQKSDCSVTIDVDDVGPGLRIKRWMSNDTDFLTTYGRLQGMKEVDATWEVRLLPSAEVMTRSTIETWWAVIVQRQQSRDQGKAWAEYCATDIDNLAYGGKSLGMFRMTIDGDGMAVAMEIVGLRTRLNRILPDENACAWQDSSMGQFVLNVELNCKS